MKPSPPGPVRDFAFDFSPMRKIRLGEEITQKQLAVAAGMHPLTVWRLEKGKVRNPSLKHLVGIARALGVPMYRLFTVTDNPSQGR